MADYKDKLDEWQRAARRKARELDEKYGIKDRIEEGARAAGKRASKKAGEVLGSAKGYYNRASKVVDAGARFTRASGSATSALFKAGDWIKKNPGKAALVTLSLATGVRAGAAFPGLD